MTDIGPNIRQGVQTNGIKFCTSKNKFVLTRDVTWPAYDSLNQWIGLLSGETFDGEGHTITVANLSHPGVLSTAAVVPATTVVIKNLTVVSNVITNGGGIMFTGSTNFTLSKCKHFGDVQAGAGGLIGSGCRNFTVSKCFSKGDLVGAEAGGVGGKDCCQNSNASTTLSTVSGSVSKTSFHGNLTANGCGGMFGNGFGKITVTNTGATTTNIVLHKCKTKGQIGLVVGTSYCGGLVGGSVTAGVTLGITSTGATGLTLGVATLTVNVDNCLVRGNIVAQNSGGLFASNMGSKTFTQTLGAGAEAANVTAINVTSTVYRGVNNGNNSGGFFGNLIGGAAAGTAGGAVVPTFNLAIATSYVVGNISGDGAGGFIGGTGAVGEYSSYRPLTITNSYVVGDVTNVLDAAGAASTGTATAICGIASTVAAGSVVFTNCYAYSTLSGTTNAGIRLTNAGAGTTTAFNCYSNDAAVVGAINALTALISTIGTNWNSSIWKSERKSYPRLRVFTKKPWHHYHHFDSKHVYIKTQ